MKSFPFPLRFSIPVILLLFGSLLGLFSFQREIYLSYLRTERDASRQAKFSGNHTSGILEYLYRRGDVEEAEILISHIGSDLNLRFALLSDENNRVILSNHYELRNHLIKDTLAASSLSVSERVRQTQSGQVIVSQDGQTIRAIYPVVLGSAPGEIRPSKVGVLFLEYDLSVLKRRTYLDALKRSLEYIAVLALLCAAVWLFFEKTLTWRAVRLVQASNNLAKGLNIRAELQGSDELAQIAAAFNKMAQQIQVNQQELQELTQQRRELLNLLVSQIRNSFDLETILSTAVRETCNLLGVDRCNFMWYESDPLALSFALTHESQLPGLLSVLGQYPIENPNSSYLKDLLSFKTVRIDNLTTDTFLDAPLRSRLIAQGYVSFISCPIQTRSSKLGIVNCGYCHTLYSWSDDEVELLQSVANQLAIAINQAELYEQTRVAATTATAQAEQLRLTLEELQQIQALLQVTLDSTADGILAINQAGNIAGFNKKFVEMWGIPESLLMLQDNQGLAFVIEQIIDPQTSPFKVGELSVQANAKNYDILVTKDGRIFERYSQPQRLNGKIVGEVWSFRDITERSLAEAKIRYQALHDLLTGLPNRMLFHERLSLALINAQQRQGILAVMFMDLDRFKTINDTLGHAIGDRLLQDVAKRLKPVCGRVTVLLAGEVTNLPCYCRKLLMSKRRI